MGVWDLKGLDDQVKKYLKLSLDESFDEKQKAKFGAIAFEAKEQLERLKAQWEDNAKDRKGEDK
jgi:hypothetical protein